jgi:predicted nucleotidyltransferase
LTTAADAALDRIDESVRPTTGDYERLHAKADEVAEALTRNAVCGECRLVGSVARLTALRGYSDVDLLAIMNAADGPRHAIVALAAALTTAGFAVRTDEIVAEVDVGGTPAVDVMPAIHDESLGYLIPAGRDDEWQVFHPEPLKELTERSMRRLGPRFASVVRLAKLWNITRDVGFKSSDLEELACIALGDLNAVSSHSRCLTRVLALSADWIGGDLDTQRRMGRPFPSSGHDARTLAVVRDSIAVTRAMWHALHDEEAYGLMEVFFGGELVERVH